MYPAPEVLEEIGRVTICGARLDLQLAYLCWHLEPARATLEELRPMSGSELGKLARKLAGKHLDGGLLAQALASMDDADLLRRERNEVVHQEWVLRGRDAFPSSEDVAGLDDEALEAYRLEWERQGRPSPDWLRLPARSTDLEPAHELDHLVDLERRLGGLAARVMFFLFPVASARETGKPAGYRP